MINGIVSDLVAERLRLCYLEIEGIRRAFRYPPANAQAVPQVNDGVWACTIIGPELSPASASAGVLNDYRRYTCRVFSGTVAGDTSNSGDLGSVFYARLIPFLSRVPRYFRQHSKLQTADLPALVGILLPVEIQDRGIGQRLGPGGVEYITYDCDLTIKVKENA